MSERPELTIRLERDPSSGLLLRRFYRPKYGHLEDLDSETPWKGLGPSIELDGAKGLEPLTWALDVGNAETLFDLLTRDRLVEVGHDLLHVLLGEPQQWCQILRGLFGVGKDEPDPTPLRRGARLRICTDDPLLATLPWRFTAWQGRWLTEPIKGAAAYGPVGWTFETVTSERVDLHVAMPVPCKILVVAPRCIEAGTDQHLLELREVLENLSSHYGGKTFLTVVENASELRKALRGMRPHILYFYGHGVVEGGQASLLLGRKGEDSRPLTMAGLHRALAEPLPRIAYLNGCWTGASGWQGAGRQLSPGVPFVLTNRTRAWSEHAGASATRFFKQCLSGHDPLETLHHLPPGTSTRDFQWGTSVAWTSYRTWSTSSPLPSQVHEYPGLRLDRDQQRALAYKHVHELTESRERRVEAMVGFGGTGSLVEQFGTQVHDYLRGQGIRLRWITRPHGLGPPSFDVDALEEDLGLWLDREDFEALQHLLQRWSPDRLSDRIVPVLVLDWGSLGTEEELPSHDDLEEWLRFAAERLAPACPETMRVVCFLAAELPPKKHGDLDDALEMLAGDLENERFSSRPLPVLADVRQGDIRRYLSDRTHTNCPPTLAVELSKLIYKKTKGRYEATVALIEQGETDSWHRLLKELRLQE